MICFPGCLPFRFVMRFCGFRVSAATHPYCIGCEHVLLRRRDPGWVRRWGCGGYALITVVLAHSCLSIPGVGFGDLFLPAFPRNLRSISLQKDEMSLVCPAVRWRYLALTCNSSKCDSIDVTCVSVSNTRIGVARNAPVIVRKHLFCMTASLLVAALLFPISFGVWLTDQVIVVLQGSELENLVVVLASVLFDSSKLDQDCSAITSI